MQLDIAVSSYDDLYLRYDRRDYALRIASRELLENLRIMAQGEEVESVNIHVAHRNAKVEEKVRESLQKSFELSSKYWNYRRKVTVRSAIWYFVAAVILVLMYALVFFVWSEFAAFFYPVIVILSWVLVWNGFESLAIDDDEEVREFFKRIKTTPIAFV